MRSPDSAGFDKLVRKMDDCGIDMAILLADDYGLARGDPPTSQR